MADSPRSEPHPGVFGISCKAAVRNLFVEGLLRSKTRLAGDDVKRGTLELNPFLRLLDQREQMNEEDLQSFCTDADFHELIELSRSSDDMLSLISLRENQHSDLMAWAMDAGEGHGEGDAVFKDFLLAVYKAASETYAGDRLRKNSHSWHFVQHWTPAKILAADFGSVVCYREYTIKTENAKKKRPDFVVVDPSNQLLIVIEVKAGAAFGKNQLSDYLTVANQVLVTKGAFKGFHKAFVAMDINLDPGQLPAAFDSRWVGMDYSWANQAAKRAEIAIERGNGSARLLLEYCRWLTGYESPIVRRLNRLARNLVIRHPSVAFMLNDARKSSTSLESWTTRLLDGDAPHQQLFRLYLQYRRALDWLAYLSPIQLLRAKLSETFPLLDEHPELTNSGLVWYERRLPLEVDNQLPEQNGWWPLYLRVRYLKKDDQAVPKFRISLFWWAASVKGHDEMEFTAKELGKEFGKEGLERPKKNTTTLYDERVLGVEAAAKVSLQVIQRVQTLWQKRLLPAKPIAINI